MNEHADMVAVVRLLVDGDVDTAAALVCTHPHPAALAGAFAANLAQAITMLAQEWGVSVDEVLGAMGVRAALLEGL